MGCQRGFLLALVPVGVAETAPKKLGTVAAFGLLLKNVLRFNVNLNHIYLFRPHQYSRSLDLKTLNR